MPWEGLEQLIRPYYYEGKYGNKPYELELMLRIHLLQNLYDLSDQNNVALSECHGSRISFVVNRSVRYLPAPSPSAVAGKERKNDCSRNHNYRSGQNQRVSPHRHMKRHARNTDDKRPRLVCFGSNVSSVSARGKFCQTAVVIHIVNFGFRAIKIIVRAEQQLHFTAQSYNFAVFTQKFSRINLEIVRNLFHRGS